MLLKIFKYIAWSWVFSAVLGLASTGFVKSVLPQDSLLTEQEQTAANANFAPGQIPARFKHISSDIAYDTSRDRPRDTSQAKTRDASASDRARFNELAQRSHKLLDDARDEIDAVKACEADLSAISGYNKSRLSSRCSCSVREIGDPPKAKDLMGLVVAAAQLKHSIDIAPSPAQRQAAQAHYSKALSDLTRNQRLSNGSIFTAQNLGAIIDTCGF